MEYHSSGVYTLTFGERFYVGVSNYLGVRMGQHKRAINGLLAGNQWSEKNNYYEQIITHLSLNLEIEECVMKLIDPCQASEEFWINKLSKTTGACLNYGCYVDYSVEETIKMVPEKYRDEISNIFRSSNSTV